MTGLPLVSLGQKEAAAIGAAIMGFLGAGVFSSVEEGQKAVSFSGEIFEPTSKRKVYEELYQQYKKTLFSLREVYSGGGALK